MKSKIGYKLVIALVLFSSLITLITTALQLYIDYRVDIKRVNNYETLIRKSYLESITTSVWLYDDKQIKTQLHGILHLPDMERIQIHSDEGTNWSVGSIKSKNNLTKEFSLIYDHKGDDTNIGIMRTVIGLDSIYTRLLKKTFTILLSNAIKIFLVAGFTLLIFQYLLTRHLYSLSSWLKNIDIGRSFDKFYLDRTISKSNKTDELDEVVLAINKMQDNLKKNLDNLIKSEKKYRGIFENAVEGFFQSTPEGSFISVNPAFAKMLGYASPEELISNISDIAKQYYVNNEDRYLYKQLLLKAGSVEHYEFKARCKNGSHIWVSNSTRAIYDRDGKIIRYEGNVTDITGRKLTEMALQASHKQFLRVLDGIDATIYVVDIKTYEILFMNKYMKESFGRDMIGETCWESYRGESKPCMNCPNDKLFDENGKPSEVFVWHAKNPITGKWYINHDRAIEWTDERLVKLQIATDITNLKKMEEELRQARKMESIGTLTSGIAHDFNNIMGIILGNTELALEDVPESSRAYSNLEAIKTASRRATNIVKQLRNLSRITDQKLQPIKIAPVIKDALKFLRSTIPSTIDIQQDIQITNETILADPILMNQIIMNLCINASHAMEQTSGNLTIIVENVLLDDSSAKDYPGLKSGNHVKIMVSDTGPGIDPDIIDRIFDPYFTTKGVGKGSGMGLAVVHSIVKSHSGSITVDSTLGKGTKFIMFFPLVTEKPIVEVKTT